MLAFNLAVSSDAAILTDISKRSFDSDVEVGASFAGGPPGYDSTEFHEQMAEEKHLYKLTDDGVIVGGAVLFKERDTMNVGRIFVDPQHFGKGYGIYIMQQIEQQFSDVTRFALDTPLWNVRTNRFYQKLGYTEYKRDDEFAYYIKQKEVSGGIGDIT